MRWIWTIALLAVFSLSAKSQQALQHTWYMWDPFGWNPAWAGMDGSLVFTGMLRKQWVQHPGSPLTRSFNAHMPVFIASGGAGLRFKSHELGLWQVNELAAAWNYQLELSRTAILSFGVEAGMVQRQLDGARIRTPEGIYLPEPAPIDHQDDLLPDGVTRASVPTFGAGLYLLTQKFGAGVAVQQLTSPALAFDRFAFQLDRTLIFSAGYSWEVSRSVVLLPSVLVKSDVVQTQTDISLLAQFNDNIFGGLSVRGYSPSTLDAASVLLGVRLGAQWWLGYSYDMGLGPLQQAANGSHELIVRYNLGKPIGKGKLPPVIYNPRDL